MVEWAACGKSPADIARQVGYSEGYVQAIFRSPLFQQEVANVQVELKSNVIKEFARHTAGDMLPAMQTLSTIHADPNEKATDRITAAKAVVTTGLELFMPQRKKRQDEDDGAKKLVIEGSDLKDLIQAVSEVKQVQRANNVTPPQAAGNRDVGRSQTAPDTVARAKVYTIDEIEEMEAAREERESEEC